MTDGQSDIIWRMTPFLTLIQNIKNVKSLAILLEVDVLEEHPLDVRINLVKKWMDRQNVEYPVGELIKILKQPALREVRIAEEIGKLFPDYIGIEKDEILPYSCSTSISSAHLEAIGKRTDDCTRKNVLNCIAVLRLKNQWNIIGEKLIPFDFDEENIKNECRYYGDEAAYMVDAWWRQTDSREFSWPALQEAITRALEIKYGHYNHSLVSSNEDLDRRCREVQMDMEDLQDDFERLQLSVMKKLKKRYRYREIKERLKVCNRYEPHYEKDIRHILGTRRVKSVDQFFEKIQRCWNFLDIGLLQILIKVFIRSHTTQDRINKYNTRLQRFKQTPIALVVHVLRRENCHPREVSDNRYKKIIQKLDLNPDKDTLEYLDNIRKRHRDKLRDLSLLQTSLMVFDRADFSCILVTWLIRDDQVGVFEKMFEICAVEGTFFNDNFIISVKINGHFYQTKEWALLEASSSGDVKKVDSLLQSWRTIKNNINKTDQEGKTGLIRAAEKGHIGVVALLLEHKAVKIDYQTPGKLWTALFFAYFCGHLGVVKLLEEYGANKNIKDMEGKTAKELSTIKQKFEQKMPGKSGVGDRIVSTLKKLTPGWKKIEKKKIHALCEHGDLEEVKKMILFKAVEVDVTDGYPRNWTPLMCACYGGHYDIVEFLLERGADVHVKSTKKDWTALHIAAARNHLRITNLLLRKGAYPNEIIDPDDLHHTALMFIANKNRPGYVEIARTLLKHGADVDIPNKLDNETPLFSAVSAGNVAMVELFLEYHADCNRLGHKGWSPLMEAARSSAEVCKILIDHGAKTDLAMQAAGKVSGDTALHVACYYGEADVVRALVAGGADPNRENEIGLTPLMVATKRNHVDAINSLGESKLLNINHLHKRTGLSPIFVAASSGSIDVCEALLKHGASPVIDDLSIMEFTSWRHKNKLKTLIQEYKSEVKPVPQMENIQPNLFEVAPATQEEFQEELPANTPKELAREQEAGEDSHGMVGLSEEGVEPAASVGNDISSVAEVDSQAVVAEDIVKVEDEDKMQTIPESTLNISDLELKTNEMSLVESVATSTQDNKTLEYEKSVASDVGMEEPGPTDEPKMVDDDDDDSYFSDEAESKPSDKIGPNVSEDSKEKEFKQELIKQWKRMTPGERMKLMDMIWKSYKPDYPVTGTGKGVQQPVVPSSPSQEIYATGT